MLVKALLRLHRVALFVALAVALVATGFAHRMPTAQDEAVAYALSNGVSLADLCAGDLDGDGPRDLHCLSCQIAAAADLPPLSSAIIALELAFHAQVIAPRETLARRSTLDPAHTPQGPPVA